MTHSDELVLIVEDDADVRDLLVRRLERLGYRTQAVDSGEAALEVAAKDTPQLAVVDIILPGMDGWELIRRLRDDARTAEMPVLVASILDEPEDSETPGIEGYLVKPFKARDLEGALKAIEAGGT